MVLARAGGNTDIKPLGGKVTALPWAPTTGSKAFTRAAGAAPRPQARRGTALGGGSVVPAHRVRKMRLTPRSPKGPARHLLLPRAGVRATGPPSGLASGRRAAPEPYCAAQPFALGLFPSGTRGAHFTCICRAVRQPAILGCSVEPLRCQSWALLGVAGALLLPQLGGLLGEPIGSPLLTTFVVLRLLGGVGGLAPGASGLLTLGPLASPPLSRGLGRALALAVLPGRPVAALRAIPAAMGPAKRPGVLGAARLVPILKARLPRAARPLRMAPTSLSPALLQALRVFLVPLTRSPRGAPRAFVAATAAAAAAVARAAAILPGVAPAAVGSGAPRAHRPGAAVVFRRAAASAAVVVRGVHPPASGGLTLRGDVLDQLSLRALLVGLLLVAGP